MPHVLCNPFLVIFASLTAQTFSDHNHTATTAKHAATITIHHNSTRTKSRDKLQETQWNLMELTLQIPQPHRLPAPSSCHSNPCHHKHLPAPKPLHPLNVFSHPLTFQASRYIGPCGVHRICLQTVKLPRVLDPLGEYPSENPKCV
ncbi:hypothetical protein B0T16DRAFT_414760 [Cercophora newfieldiana]|uniref:Secreted protein n=1 Tax=Cercophora newfieldiana TaxID=92897 RepID=A0AA39Y732_9PEZI|nr:hypothetical protein B0T16DRAFT_414760 [Cercophora newfieldiana]